MAEILTNIADLTAYDAWVAALPGVDDGNIHVASFTNVGEYAPADPVNPAVAIRIQAAAGVSYDFENPTDPHVAFTATSGSAFTLQSAEKAVVIKGIRLETTDVNANVLSTNAFLNQLITLELCRVIGGQHGIEARDQSVDEVNTLNCVFSGQRFSGVYTKRSASTHDRTVVVNSNTDNNASFGGFYCRVGTTLINCVAYNNGSKDYAITGASLLNCASGDTTVYGTSPVNGVTSPDFTNTASDIWTTAAGGLLEGAGTGGTDIGLSLSAVDSIMILTPTEWELYQRSGNNDAVVSITGTYTSVTPPVSIEYSYDGSPFATLDASPTGGAFAGNVTLPVGNATLVVRFSNDVGVTTFVDNIAVGIKALFWGQSNFVGVATNAQSYTGASGLFHKYTVTNDIWQEGNDPFLTSTNLGSLFPLLATHFANNKNIPVGFIGVASGSTNVSQWQPGEMLNLRMLDYLTNSGGNDVEFIASWIGESDASQGTLESTFKTQYNTVIDQLKTLTGADSFICGIAEVGVAQDSVRQWIEDISNTNVNVKGYVNMNLVYQGLHYETDQETADTALALYEGLSSTFFGSSVTFTAAGIPDGSYLVTVVSDTRPATLITSQNLTFTSDTATVSLELDAGTQVYGLVRDALDPSVSSASLKAITV